MTVTGVNIDKIDVLPELQMGYYYGSDPVVTTTLTVESLWLRDWTTRLMPDDVKVALGIETETDGDEGMDEEDNEDDGGHGGRGGG